MIKGKQREQYKKVLAHARYLKHEAEVLHKNVVLYDLRIPTIKELDKMNYEDAKALMQDLRNFRTHLDLVKKKNLGGALVSDYEKKRISRMSRATEKKKEKMRSLIEEQSIPGLMGTEIETQTRPAPINADDIEGADFDAVVKRLEIETSKAMDDQRREQYYTNYVKGVYNVFGDIANLDYIYSIIHKIPADIFYVLTQTTEYLQLAFIYDDLIGLSERYEVFLNDLVSVAESYDI